MDFDILYLNANKDSPSKNLILKLLVINSNLTINKIQSLLRQEFGKKISYQGIRQLVLELIDDKVLIRDDNEYIISSDWVEKVKLEVNLLEKSINEKKKIKVLKEGTTQISIKNLYELGHFILYSLEQKYFDLNNKDSTYMIIDHLWIPFSDESKRDRLSNLLQNYNFKVFVDSNSTFDKMLSKWYKKYVSVKLGSKFNYPCSYIVHGNLVVQIYFNSDLKKKMDKFYSLKGMVSYGLFEDFSSMTYEDNPIEIIIAKNKLIADGIKNKIKNS